MDRIKRITGLTDSDFKKEMTDNEIKKIQKCLKRYLQVFPDTFKQFTKGSYYILDSAEGIFGLPYTSSGVCAELAITNIQWNPEKNVFMRGFVLTNDNNLIGYASRDTEKGEIEEHYYFTKI